MEECEWNADGTRWKAVNGMQTERARWKCVNGIQTGGSRWKCVNGKQMVHDGRL